MTSNQNITTADQMRAAGELLQLTIAGVKVNFRWAPAGKFMMGSPESEKGHCADEFQHEVTLTQGFWIAETPTTQELWRAVMGYNPSLFKGNELPVDGATWDESCDFVEKLNCSYCDVLPNGSQYAMPTEAQWEYACRAGTTTPFNFGSALNGDKANCYGKLPYGTSVVGEAKSETTPVKSYPPNAWGCTTCTVMWGSGAPTGTIGITMPVQTQLWIPRGLLAVRPTSYAAVPLDTTLNDAGRRSEAAVILGFG